MKWFKHDSDASNDAKLKKLRLKYGAQGYGIYWYCLELIARNVDKNNLTFELEHDAELIADDFKLSSDLVQHIMTFMVEIGLFENLTGVITCLKMASRTDEYTQKLIQSIKKTNDNVTTLSRQSTIKSGLREEKRTEEIRLEENRTEEKKQTIKGSRLSQDWIISDEYIEFCKTERPDLDVKLVADNFKDFWISKSGSDATKLDWFATWRNWVRKERVISNVKKPMKGYGFISDAEFNDWLDSAPIQERIANERLS
jgi:hypothetical protein